MRLIDNCVEFLYYMKNLLKIYKCFIKIFIDSFYIVCKEII